MNIHPYIFYALFILVKIRQGYPDPFTGLDLHGTFHALVVY